METSNEFKTVKEFNKAYKVLRLQILHRHGYTEGSKVKLVRAVMLWVNFGDGFIKYTSNLSDMKDRIKMYETNEKAVSFKLSAMV